jgi:DNA-binding MarR family transcriptional regulator
MTTASPRRDGVDAIVGQWSRERPDLDTATMELFGRVYRVADRMGEQMSRTFAPFGLTRGEFDVLATLRRAGAPYRLSPGELSASLMVTTGGMTGRLDKLTAAGLLERVPHATDRRCTYAQLTDEGVDLVERAVEAQVQAQRYVLDALGATGVAELSSRLRELLDVVDRPRG